MKEIMNFKVFGKSRKCQNFNTKLLYQTDVVNNMKTFCRHVEKNFSKREQYVH